MKAPTKEWTGKHLGHSEHYCECCGDDLSGDRWEWFGIPDSDGKIYKASCCELCYDELPKGTN